MEEAEELARKLEGVLSPIGDFAAAVFRGIGAGVGESISENFGEEIEKQSYFSLP